MAFHATSLTFPIDYIEIEISELIFAFRCF